MYKQVNRITRILVMRFSNTSRLDIYACLMHIANGVSSSSCNIVSIPSKQTRLATLRQKQCVSPRAPTTDNCTGCRSQLNTHTYSSSFYSSYVRSLNGTAAVTHLMRSLPPNSKPEWCIRFLN